MQRLKAQPIFKLAARLKACPDTNRAFDGIRQNLEAHHATLTGSTGAVMAGFTVSQSVRTRSHS